MPEHIECIRCGVCCIQAPACMEGSTDETENGLCSYLTIHENGFTSCKNYAPVMNTGCMLRRFREVYEYNKNEAERRVKVKLANIIE